ncbi:hypothetical protein FF38_03155 [Lucilia cuprina]|uniref:Uncharacterized protein n=1 Tax=Lucilia cuprina TaxID=7375 RepID=A0A0L0BUR1_LUCCU|nr:hypothetical protein FF38_03155 [Lucilia cuprina]
MQVKVKCCVKKRNCGVQNGNILGPYTPFFLPGRQRTVTFPDAETRIRYDFSPTSRRKHTFFRFSTAAAISIIISAGSCCSPSTSSGKSGSALTGGDGDVRGGVTGEPLGYAIAWWNASSRLPRLMSPRESASSSKPLKRSSSPSVGRSGSWASSSRGGLAQPSINAILLGDTGNSTSGSGSSPSLSDASTVQTLDSHSGWDDSVVCEQDSCSSGSYPPVSASVSKLISDRTVTWDEGMSSSVGSCRMLSSSEIVMMSPWRK